MQPLYDPTAPKRATNLSINSDLLQKSKAMNINLSAALESTLKQILVQRQAEQWKAANRAGIVAYNDFVEENGCFGDEYRHF